MYAQLKRARAALALTLVGVVAAGCDVLPEPTAPDAASTPAARVQGARFSSAAANSGGASYLIRLKGNASRIEERVVAAGGTLTALVPQIDMAVATSSDPDFAERLGVGGGVGAVLPDVQAQWLPGEASRGTFELEVLDALAIGDPPASGEDDAFFDLQWAADAIDLPEAIGTGYRGQGVRVGILDSGIRSTHADLAPNLNMALSTSFVPGEAYDSPAGAHGTHVAGIVAAADNGIGTIGVASSAEIVAVKVLSAFSGSGAFSWIAQGIVYAADNDVDVINMSLGASFPRHGFFSDPGTPNDPSDDIWVPANDVAELVNFLKAATSYASKQGVTIISSAGNDANNGNADADLLHLPSDLPGVISISASGPTGWALEPETNLDRLASYSNFGRSVVDLGAPGGDFVLPGNDLCIVANVALAPCWVFDMVLSTSSSSDFGYAWNAGTSMAAPHATGVAALIIGKNGGEMNPTKVAGALRKSADGVTGNGNTAEFGHGRVNAYNAVR